ncbi:T9SS type A sorting domain-containing protein [Adhaeribacter sp. BT258]|uniref:phospholipase D n=1 Tax=Adhaeribacter terrigena TaxID=2793070 RepID=A0ABS1BZI6_9BACT|nr:phospholipase D-like domain-containing protein [Adhaeribacter terrigena]MBK0402525.1 T9SS type A sorting domain-containing protein [Adhaeribacter terrigena]
MKKILSLIVFASFGFGTDVLAQSSIAAARAQAVNSTVTVRGIVTNGAELGPIRYLQDNVAGIAAYSSTMMGNVVLGDSVEVIGTLKDYNGLLEIDPVTSVNILARNKPVPAPVVFTAANALSAFAEIYEGRLVTITGNTNITSAAGAQVSTFAGNTNYRLNNNANTLVRTSTNSTGPTGIVGKPAPTAAFGLTGIMSQFAPSGSGGYQLLPRLYSDFDLGNTPNFMEAPRPINITTSGFTVTFKTQNAGTSKVDYGTSPTTLSSNATNTTSTTNHTITLSGLQPATVYYVQVTATNAVGSSVSSTIPMITASNSTGKMTAYFNRPADHTYGPVNNPAKTLQGAIDDTLIAYINRAQQTVDFTMYSFDNANLSNLTTALNNAKTRGVVVRVISESGNTNTALNTLSPTIPLVKRTTTRGIMHNKFVVIDANSANPNKPIVWTGSTNYTDNQVITDPNSVIIIQDQSLAKVYTMEFNEMFGNGTLNGGVFGAAKMDNTPHHLNIGGVPVQLYFSPSDNVNARIIETINSADHDLNIATMLVTRTDIANAIKNRMTTNPGMQPMSGILMNDTSSSASNTPYAIMKNALGNRILIDNNFGIMHHKFMVADVGDKNSDPQLLVGSHNWSNGADTENDENTLIIHNWELANQYYQEFAARFNGQNAGVKAYNFMLLGLAKDLKAEVKTMKVYPNPNAGRFQVSVTDKNISQVNITLTDVTGKTVYETSQKVNGEQDINIETSNLPKGMYNLQLRSEKGTQVSKVVIY